MSNYFSHSTALVESESIGDDTKIWCFSHITEGAIIGKNCNIGEHCYIESGSFIGDNVTIKNGCSIWDGVTIQKGAFIGPNVAFTNDSMPRSPRERAHRNYYKNKKNWLEHTLVKEGVSIGANSTILSGLTIHEFAMIGAGSVVTKDINSHTLVYGNPARFKYFLCECCNRLNFINEESECVNCGSVFRKKDNKIHKILSLNN